MYQVTISELLRRLRLVAEYKQSELAYKMGYSSTTVSRIENGKLKPTEEYLHQFIEALSLSTAEQHRLWEVFSRKGTSQPQRFESASPLGSSQHDTRKVSHNLPQPDYLEFIGRDEELRQLEELLAPHKRAWIVVIDGLGGVGKTALALEMAYRFMRDHDKRKESGPGHQFEAIVWISAKQAVLTAMGIQPRHQVSKKLEDIYVAIESTLPREKVSNITDKSREQIIYDLLAQKRTLLIIDNFETIDDEDILAFLRELPQPTKAIITTRQRIDVAYPIRLEGMSRQDAEILIGKECEKKKVLLTDMLVQRLSKRTGGNPLAIVWSVGLMSFYNPESVLQRLGQPTSDIARFCFAAVIERIRDKPSHQLLMALALFVSDADRKALGHTTSLSPLDVDDGLAELEILSLINRNEGRFNMLPLTQLFAKAELTQYPHIEVAFRHAQLEWYKSLARQLENEEIAPGYVQRKELDNVIGMLNWCFENQDCDSILHLLRWSLSMFDHFRDYWSDRGRFLDMALRCAEKLNREQDRLFLQIDQIWFNAVKGEFTEAVRIGRQIERNHPALEGQQAIKYNNYFGDALLNLGEFDEALTWFDRARQQAEEQKNERGIILSHYYLGKAYLAQENYIQARDQFQISLQQAQLENWSQMTIHNLLGAARCAFFQEDFGAAESLCWRALSINNNGGNNWWAAKINLVLAHVAQSRGDLQGARQLATDVVRYCKQWALHREMLEAEVILEQLRDVERNIQ